MQVSAETTVVAATNRKVRIAFQSLRVMMIVLWLKA